MVVQPVVAEILPGGAGYVVRFEAPWLDFPSDDAVADAARMNRWIESEIRRNPAQYLWVHRALQDAAAGRAVAVLSTGEPARRRSRGGDATPAAAARESRGG